MSFREGNGTVSSTRRTINTSKAWALCAATLLIAGCTGTSRPRVVTPPQGAVVLDDLSPRFLAFYDSSVAGRLTPDDRWLVWKRAYGFAAVPPTPFGDTLARRLLDSAWRRYPAVLPRIRRGAAALDVAPEAELKRVVALFGCGERTRVRLVVFVGGFEENAFAFTSRTVPTIAVPLEAGDARRSLLHEFTHAVHRSPGCADIRSGYDQSLSELVISEGLAMRAVEALIPGLPATYYIIADQQWLDTARARRREIMRGIREHVGDRGSATAQRFTFGAGTTGLSREAYYAGWELTGALIRSGMSLHDIAVTPASRLPELILRAIDLLGL
jgi:hypothetical protein